MSGQRRITAKEARALQPGTRLTWHGLDGQGLPVQTTGRIVQFGKEKRLEYVPARGMAKRWAKIQDDQDWYYTIED